MDWLTLTTTSSILVDQNCLLVKLLQECLFLLTIVPVKIRLLASNRASWIKTIGPQPDKNSFGIYFKRLQENSFFRAAFGMPINTMITYQAGPNVSFPALLTASVLLVDSLFSPDSIFISFFVWLCGMVCFVSDKRARYVKVRIIYVQ